jgi:hypothetical protein
VVIKGKTKSSWWYLHCPPSSVESEERRILYSIVDFRANEESFCLAILCGERRQRREENPLSSEKSEWTTQCVGSELLYYMPFDPPFPECHWFDLVGLSERDYSLRVCLTKICLTKKKILEKI